MSAPHSKDVDRGSLILRQSDADKDLVGYKDAIQSANPFGAKYLYNSSIDNALFMADVRWTVAGSIQKISDGSVVSALTATQRATLFNHDYLGKVGLEPGQQLDLHITFPQYTGGEYPGGYPYGAFFLSFYSSGIPDAGDASIRVYCTHQTQGVGWKNLLVQPVGVPSSPNTVLRFDNSWFGITEIHVVIKNTRATGTLWPSQVEHHNSRRSSAEVELPYVSKLEDQRLYKRLTWRDSTRTENAYIDEDGSSYFKSISSPSLDVKLDKPTTGTPSATTALYGDGSWKVPTDTNTTYPVLTQAIADTGTATTAQSISALVLKTTIGKLTAALKAEILGGVGPAFDTLAELKAEYEGTDANLTALIGGKLDKAPANTPATQYLNGSGGYSVPPNTTYLGMLGTDAEAGTGTESKLISSVTLKSAIQKWVTGASATAVTAIGQALNKAGTALEARTAIGAEQEGWVGTTTAYNALSNKDPNRNYYLTD